MKKYLIVPVLLFGIYSCNTINNELIQPLKFSFVDKKFSIKQIPENTDRIDVTLSRSSNFQSIKFSLSKANPVKIVYPDTGDYFIDAKALDDKGNLLAEASSNIKILPYIHNKITLTMALVSPSPEVKPSASIAPEPAPVTSPTPSSIPVPVPVSTSVSTPVPTPTPSPSSSSSTSTGSSVSESGNSPGNNNIKVIITIEPDAPNLAP